jgi:ABC-type polysaccharide/polyol phosphate export permease
VRFPRQILPFSVILTHLVHFGIQSTLIIAVLALFPTEGPVVTPNLLWLAPILVVHIGLCVGLGLLVSALNVVFRDTRYIVDSALTVLFWVSPVIYDARSRFEESVGADGTQWTLWERAYFLNPVAGILDSYRAVLFHGAAPDPFVFLTTIVLTLALGALGLWTFWRYEREFAELVR